MMDSLFVEVDEMCLVLQDCFVGLVFVVVEIVQHGRYFFSAVNLLLTRHIRTGLIQFGNLIIHELFGDSLSKAHLPDCVVSLLTLRLN